jgi:hypothetical protein
LKNLIVILAIFISSNFILIHFKGKPGESMSMAIPVITATPIDVMNNQNSYIIETSIIPNSTIKDKTHQISKKFQLMMRTVFANPEDVHKVC